jgi:ABC-2 type transport system ATP-binding protein
MPGAPRHPALYQINTAVWLRELSAKYGTRITLGTVPTQEIRRLVGYMPDRFGSYDNMRVREYLDFFGAAFGIPRRQRVKRIDETMEMTGTTYMKDRFVESLSHGMQQRVGVARTLLHDPQVLILDEPANGLDPQARIEMRDLLLKLAQLGKALLVTSHILPELSRICDRVGILMHGKLRAFGTIDQIARQVSQRRTVEAHLTREAQVHAAAEIIRRGIELGAEVIEATAETAVRFRTALPESELGRILAQLVQEGIEVTQFREEQTDLEEAFMSFARPAEQREAAAVAVAGETHG